MGALRRRLAREVGSKVRRRWLVVKVCGIEEGERRHYHGNAVACWRILSLLDDGSLQPRRGVVTVWSPPGGICAHTMQ